jgi:hypothetical protein
MLASSGDDAQTVPHISRPPVKRATQCQNWSWLVEFTMVEQLAAIVPLALR